MGEYGPPPDAAAFAGCLLGTAVGDAMGLPFEGMTARRVAAFLGQEDAGAGLERPRFLWRWGMVSDDTEHTCLVAQSLLSSRGDADAFARHLAWRLRCWLLGLPAGLGSATLRSCLRLWCGFSPARSGVASAGNGAAMRSALIGLWAGADDALLAHLVRVSTRITHRDGRAQAGAVAVALAARDAWEESRGGAAGAAPAGAAQGTRGARFLAALDRLCGSSACGGEGMGAWQEVRPLVVAAAASARRGESTPVFARGLGLGVGVSGYILHTLPVALHAWFRHGPDLRAAVEGTIRCGGDTDTTAAIAGAISGACAGREGIPALWLGALAEWPRSVSWMERLATRLAAVRAGAEGGALPLFWPALLPRNLLFDALVLLHGFRRLLPPYGARAALSPHSER